MARTIAARNETAYDTISDHTFTLFILKYARYLNEHDLDAYLNFINRYIANAHSNHLNNNEKLLLAFGLQGDCKVPQIALTFINQYKYSGFKAALLSFNLVAMVFLSMPVAIVVGGHLPIKLFGLFGVHKEISDGNIQLLMCAAMITALITTAWSMHRWESYMGGLKNYKGSDYYKLFENIDYSGKVENSLLEGFDNNSAVAANFRSPLSYSIGADDDLRKYKVC